MTKPLTVSLFAGPGTGKSTTMGLVFGRLKERGHNAELVPEYAKDLTWEEAWGKLAHQPYVAAKQMWRLDRLKDRVDVIVTDTSTLLGLIYGKASGGRTQAFDDWLVDDYKRRWTLNIFLERDPSRPYNPAGRRQSEASAIDADARILSMLNDLGVPYLGVRVNKDDGAHVDRIVHETEQRLKAGPDGIFSSDIKAHVRTPLLPRSRDALVEFYSVKHRKKVHVPASHVEKKKYERQTSRGPQERYALQVQTLVDGDPVKLTKFVGKEDYDRL